MQRCNDIRITGFPVKENENLSDLFTSIAKEIGFEIDQQFCTPSIERIPIKNRTTGAIIKSQTILVHFTTLKQKQTFYSYYLNNMPLKPMKFGLPETNRIVVGESLTNKNAKLFQLAQTMRKDGKIAQTFTDDGLVKIRMKKGKGERAYFSSIKNTKYKKQHNLITKELIN